MKTRFRGKTRIWPNTRAMKLLPSPLRRACYEQIQNLFENIVIVFLNLRSICRSMREVSTQDVDYESREIHVFDGI